MGKRRLFVIVAAVVLAHGGMLYVLKDARPLPKRKYMPPSNFTMRRAETTLSGTGKKLTYREYTVSTHLGPRPRIE